MEGEEGALQTHRRRPCEAETERSEDAGLGVTRPRAEDAGSHQELEEARNDGPLEPPREAALTTAQLRTSGLRTVRE